MTSMMQGGEEEYSYVLEAKELGNQAFDKIESGQGEQARELFEQSTAALTNGVKAHSRRMQERADNMHTANAVGTLGLGIASTIWSFGEIGDTASSSASQAIVDANARLLETLGNISMSMSGEISTAWRGAYDSQEQAVDQDQWRSVVVSDDNMARSIVRIRNRSSGMYCTGAFIAPKVIMTAAHCFDIGDTLGAFRQNTDSGKSFMTGDDEFIEITHQYQHSRWDPYAEYGDSAVAFDIAFLITSQSSQYFLPVSTRTLEHGEKLMALGYSGDLDDGDFLRIDYGCQVTDIGDHALFRNSCVVYKGNSGGPVLTTDGQVAVVGVTSGGHFDVNGRENDRTDAASVKRGAAIFGQIMEHPWAKGVVTVNPFINES
ncbi:trypsin-like serine peptidase [Halomonas elongata]|uniref:trypsin-like serine peptidase n=1 Tax=Halomonas elongata TaxID=2746 RepID=UPI0023B05E8A|nr:trypsin-like serine protease [Halomonas elongata]